ncbi:lipid kinase [Aquisalimonas lutea]|uniref:lipid kinase n=1 Tax=Aquisalimonas lutea TaxID=1327750 RepID=UPI0025B4064D|nr:lipid kinase [Aquisalimonas lutea]MDN3518055.1 lipid kinase [Aquisalimonas lutea]
MAASSDRKVQRVLLLLSAAKAEELTQARLDEIVEAMRPAEVTLIDFDTIEDGRRILQERGQGFDCIAVGGGDGTLNSLAQALCDAARPLLVIPLGTANDLARTLALPRDAPQAAAVLHTGRVHRIDLGEVNGHLFFNVASVGLSVEIAARLAGVRKRWGIVHYVGAFILGWRARKSFRIHISCDQTSLSLRSIQVSVGNGRFHGGGLAVTQDARIDDGLLGVYALLPQPLWHLLLILPALRAGAHRSTRWITILRGRQVTLSTRRQRQINADGEIVTVTPATFKVRRGALQVIIPGE